MELRTKNTQGKKLNYNSTVQFPRIDFSPSNSTTTNQLRQLELTLNNLIENFKRQRIATDGAIGGLQDRIDFLEQKSIGLERGTKVLRESRSTTGVGLYQGQESQLFRQGVMGDLAAQREEIRGQGGRLEQLLMRQGRMEQDIRQLMNRRVEWDSMKLQIGVFQRRINDQGERRAKGESQLRQYLDSRLREESSNGRGMVDTSARVAKESRENIQMVTGIVSNLRQDLLGQIGQSAKNSSAVVAKLNRRFQALQNSLEEKFRGLQKSQTSFGQEISLIKTTIGRKLQDNRRVLLEVEGNTLQRLETNMEGRRGFDSFQRFKSQYEEWRRLTQQKNLNVFREVSNAMKAVRMQWRREHDDLCKEMEQVGKKMKGMRSKWVKDVRREIEGAAKVFNQEFDVFTEEVQVLTEMMGLVKKEGEQTVVKKVEEVDSRVGQELDKIRGDLRRQTQSLKEQLAQMVNDFRLNEVGELKRKQTAIGSSIQQMSMNLTLLKETTQESLGESQKTREKRIRQMQQSLKSFIIFTSSDSYKKTQALLDVVKKEFATSQTNDRAFCVKLVGKVKDELIGLVGEVQNRMKKEKQSEQQVLHEALDIQVKNLGKSFSGELAAVKLHFEQKISDLKVKEVLRNVNEEKKNLEYKNWVQASLSKVDKRLEDEIGKIIKKIQACDSAVKKQAAQSLEKQLIKMKTQWESKWKVKQDQLQKKETQSKGKDLQAQKKTENLIVSLKKQLLGEILKEKKIIQDEGGKWRLDLEGKLKTLGDLVGKREADFKTKQLQMKNKQGQNDKKTQALFAAIRKQISSELLKAKTNQSQEIARLKGQIDVKIKQFDEQKGKKEAQMKAKQSELKVRESELKAKEADVDKKVEASSVQVKKDVQKTLTDEVGKLRAQFQLKLKQVQQQRVKRETELKSKEVDVDKKLQSLIDKKVQTVTTNAKKQMQKLNDEISKFKNDLEGKIKSNNQQISKKQSQIKAKEGEIDKKIENALNTSKKDWQTEIGKINQQIKKTKSEWQEKIKQLGQQTGKKTAAQQKSKEIEIGKKIEIAQATMRKEWQAEIAKVNEANKARQVQIAKADESKLINFKKQISLLVSNVKKELQDAVIKSSASFSEDLGTAKKNFQFDVNSLKGKNEKLEGLMNSLRQGVNKVEANIFADQQKNKAIYDRMSGDIMDIADSLSAVVSEMRPAPK